MIKLKTILLEGKSLNPLTTFDELKKRSSIVAYHASESNNFIPSNQSPLHVGSIQQSKELIRNMKKKHGKMNFYLYELNVILDKLYPKLYDEDPHLENLKDTRWNTFAYINRIEYSKGLKHGSNISLVLRIPEKQVLSNKLIELYD